MAQQTTDDGDWRDRMFSDLDFDTDDDVAIDWGNPLAGQTGTVANTRKTYTVFQYLVDLDEGGRSWIDEAHVVSPEEVA